MSGFRTVEFVFELLGEFLFGLLTLVLAYTLGSVVYAVVRVARWALAGLYHRSEVFDPNGGEWMVRVPVIPRSMRSPLGRRWFGMRTGDIRRRVARGGSPTAVTGDELAHPRRIVGMDAGAIVLAFVAVAVLVGVVVVVLELVVLIVLAAAVSMARLATGRWSIEITGPSGATENRSVRSLGDARRTRDDVVARIADGGGP